MSIAALPLGLLALAVPPSELGWGWCGLLGLGSWAAAALLLLALRLPRGHKRNRLWDEWGGSPATRRLRRQGKEHTAEAERLHAHLGPLFSDVALPTAGEEAADPIEADRRYDIVISRLRERTRHHPITFDANCRYAFRANLWGMKNVGAAVAGLTGVACAMLVALRGDVGATRPCVGLVLATALLAIWLLRVRKPWVRVMAEAYAERLLEAGLQESNEAQTRR